MLAGGECMVVVVVVAVIGAAGRYPREVLSIVLLFGGKRNLLLAGTSPGTVST